MKNKWNRRLHIYPIPIFVQLFVSLNKMCIATLSYYETVSYITVHTLVPLLGEVSWLFQSL